MNELFERCISIVLENESGLSNDPDDKGGMTNYGIAAKYHPEVDVKNLTLDEAKDIYFMEYWIPGLENLDDQNVALQIFDFAVNAGKCRSIRMAQETARCHVDGIFGNGTVLAINQSCGFLERFKTRRIRYYESLQQPKFLKGWVNRVNKTKL